MSAGALLASVPAVGASACDSFLTDAAPLLEQAFDLTGDARIVRTARVPAQTKAFVLVREHALDVTLEVSAAGKVIGRADSPIRRWTVQRIVLTTGRQPAEYSIAISGKDHALPARQVDFRVVAYPLGAANATCLAAQEKLSLAEGAYAAGHWSSAPPDAAQTPGATASNELARRYYSEAIQLLSKADSSPLLGQAQHELAQHSYDLRDWKQASAQAGMAAETYTRIAQPFERARAQMVEAEAMLEMASAPASGPAGARRAPVTFDDVRKRFASIAAFHAARGARYEEAYAINDIGLSHYQEGYPATAIPILLRALSLFEQANEQSGQALALQNAALMEYELGRLAEASAHYARVLTLIREEDDPGLYAIVLNNSALVHWGAGELDLALRQFNQALAILRVTQDPFVLPAALHNTGSVYAALGDHVRALDLYQQALALRTPERDPRGRTASLRTIGNLLRAQGKAQEALKLHDEALSLASAPAMKRRVQVQIAKDLGALGRLDDAAGQLQIVLRAAGAGEDQTRAWALAERGAQRATRGETAAAESDLREALRIFRKNETPEEELECWVQLARVMRARGAGDEALNALDRALALAEEVRMQSSNPELRATLLQPLRPAFDLRIQLLAERYFAAGSNGAARERAALSALATAEQARARALADFQSFDVSAPGLPRDLLAKRKDLFRQLAARRFRLSSILERAGADDSRVRTIRADIISLRRELDEIDARIGAASTAGAPRRGEAARAEFDFHALPKDVGVVEYWLGAEQAYAWAATREGILMAKLGASSGIDAAARSLHAALRDFGAVPESRRLELAEQLYRLVFAPVASHIGGERRLVFALDGALHYVPFATLRAATPNGPQFLVERHDISVTPSVGMFLDPAPIRGNAVAPRRMLLVADPVYEVSDVRLAKLTSDGSAPRKSSGIWPLSLFRGVEADRPLSRLPGTANEAAAIAALLPRDSVDRLEGFTATRDRFLAAGLERYRFIHIASHAVNDAEVPQASALILSTVDQRSQPADGRVLAADFVNVQLNAETVVLSACDTALGKDVAGEGLIGLQYVVLARGAGSVVSSLWPVADQVTARLMAQFYTSHLRGNAVMDAALADAMRTMLAGPFKDPSLWGAFTLTVAHAAGG
jgi:CHAT domain-containing protein